MAKQYDLVYLDSCTIIDCLQKNAERYPDVLPILKEASAKKLDIIASVLCRTEVYKIGGINTEDADPLIEAFFNQEYMHIYAIDERTAIRAGKLRLQHSSLLTWDAIHLSTAIEAKAQAMITRDNHLLDLAEEFKDTIDILTPHDFCQTLSSETKQTEIPEAHEQEQPEASH